MKNVILVAAGGAIGAVCRYFMTFLPISMDFPIKTMLTNLGGAIVIGLVVGLASGQREISPELVLFLKTGVCGGFTTFSTFSLETLNLLEEQRVLEGTLYAVVSVVACIVGVYAGKWIGSRM